MKCRPRRTPPPAAFSRGQQRPRLSVPQGIQKDVASSAVRKDNPDKRTGHGTQTKEATGAENKQGRQPRIAGNRKPKPPAQPQPRNRRGKRHTQQDPRTPRHRGGGKGQGRRAQTRGTTGADTEQRRRARQARTLQTALYGPSRPRLDRSLKEAKEGELLSF